MIAIFVFFIFGKDRIASVVKALRAIDVPVIAIVDLDILSDRAKFFELYECLGGLRADLEPELEVILRTMGSRKGQLSEAELAAELERYAKLIRQGEELSKKLKSDLTQLVKGSSVWQRIKEDGFRGFIDAPSIKAFKSIAEKSKRLGLVINPEGELESFCRQIPRTRKSEWLVKVLQRNLATDSDLEDARSFVADVRDSISFVTAGDRRSS